MIVYKIFIFVSLRCKSIHILLRNIMMLINKKTLLKP
nr:MAG TPA: hypothetical protein [Crassvirales sp.]